MFAEYTFLWIHLKVPGFLSQHAAKEGSSSPSSAYLTTSSAEEELFKNREKKKKKSKTAKKDEHQDETLVHSSAYINEDKKDDENAIQNATNDDSVFEPNEVDKKANAAKTTTSKRRYVDVEIKDGGEITDDDDPIEEFVKSSATNSNNKQSTLIDIDLNVLSDTNEDIYLITDNSQQSRLRNLLNYKNPHKKMQIVQDLVVDDEDENEGGVDPLGDQLNARKKPPAKVKYESHKWLLKKLNFSNDERIFDVTRMLNEYDTNKVSSVFKNDADFEVSETQTDSTGDNEHASSDETQDENKTKNKSGKESRENHGNTGMDSAPQGNEDITKSTDLNMVESLKKEWSSMFSKLETEYKLKLEEQQQLNDLKLKSLHEEIKKSILEQQDIIINKQKQQVNKIIHLQMP